MNYKTYILVTPVKDEEKSLPELIRSIACQAIRPTLWLIVDDHSGDGTGEIINKAMAEHPWICSIRLSAKGEYDIEEHYAYVCREGFRAAIGHCTKYGIPYDFIVLSDGDTIYSKSYFLDLIDYLIAHEKCGIVSGRAMIKSEDGSVYGEHKVLPGNEDQPMGTGRVWRKKAFEDTDGYLYVKSPDTVSNILAQVKGWSTIQLSDVIFYQTRDSGGKIDIWQGYENKGKRVYYLGSNPLNVLNTVLEITIISRQKRPITKSIAYAYGYFMALVKREKRIDNVYVRRYMGGYKKIFNNYYRFLRRLVAIRR